MELLEGEYVNFTCIDAKLAHLDDQAKASDPRVPLFCAATCYTLFRVVTHLDF